MPLPLEIFLRVAAIYVGLNILMRFTGRRVLAQLSPMDLMTMLLLSEVVSPALTANSDELWVGAIAALTLIGFTVLMHRLTFRYRKLEELIDGHALLLIKDGKVDDELMRKQRITSEELATALHEEGLLSVDQVKRGFIEPSGHISIIKQKKDEDDDD